MQKLCVQQFCIVTMFACLFGSVSMSALASDARQIDLAKTFKTRSAWRLEVAHGPPAVDYGDGPAPGALHLCLENGPSGLCTANSLPMPPPRPAGPGPAWEPHYLRIVKPVYPEGTAQPPLLLIVTASMHAGDGSQVVVTQLLKYNRADDKFERIYAHTNSAGGNMNEETRFISAGPLQGAMISADPTDDAPFGYWIEVHRFTPERTYRQVLRYRSATHYGDGNPLAVIDSEMPNIERRLGLWKPGMALPRPAGLQNPCPKPYLKHDALWCTEGPAWGTTPSPQN